jgi:hypothetical protein
MAEDNGALNFQDAGTWNLRPVQALRYVTREDNKDTVTEHE